MRVTAICECCGKKFTYPIHRGETAARRYCSLDCIGKATAAAMKKKKEDPEGQVEQWEQVEMWWQK